MPQAIPAAPEKPIREFPTPNPNNWFVSLLVARESKLYQQSAPVARGTLYATLPGADVKVVAEYPNLYFLAEIAPLGYRDPSTMPVDGYVIWYFSTEQLAEDTYNAEVTYLSENVNFPAYSRIYAVPRDAYDASPTIAPGTPLKTILAVNVTAAGSGYTSAVAVLIANGATAAAVLSASGGIASIVLTAQGSDVTSAPAVIIVGGFNISGAGTTAVNGNYTPNGISNNKPTFVNENSVPISWGGSDWIIGAEGEFYYSTEDVAYPWLVASWSLGDNGIVPSPTFSGYSGSGATAVAVIQSQSAVLVSQKKVEYPEDSPWRNEFVRVLRVYETLPGATISEIEIDPETKASITKSRTKKLISAITPSVAIVGGNTVVVKERQDIDANTAYEVVTTIPLPAAHSLITALESTVFHAQKFPGRINIAALDVYGTAIGYETPYAEVVECPVYTYWVISLTKPVVAFDKIIPDSIVINNVSYDNVLHDATVRLYNGLPVFIPATTPSYTEYTLNWIGTQRLMDGEVAPTKFQLLWRVRLYKPFMR